MNKYLFPLFLFFSIICLSTNCKSYQTIYTSNVKSYGAKGDGKHDDTQAVQNALNRGGEVYFPTGTYLVSPLKYYSNTTIMGDGKNSIIKLKFNRPPITTDLQTVLYAGNIDSGITKNVIISSLTIDGSRSEINWKNVKGDGNGNGITTWGTDNLTIKDVQVINCWTDGIFLCGTRRAKYFSNTTNFKVENIVIDNCGRQGISIISAEQGIFRNIQISNINRTAPRAGFDFEPNTLKDRIANIKVENIKIKSSGQGIVVAGVSVPKDLSFSDITITDVTHQYSISITNAEDISFDNVMVDNKNGNSKYASLYVGSARNILFDHLELFTSKGIAAIQVDSYSKLLKTEVEIRNFTISDFQHCAIYISREIDNAKFINGTIKKGNNIKSPYAAAVLHSENILIENVDFETSGNPYHIDNIGKEIRIKKSKFSKQTPMSNNINKIRN